VTHNEKKAEEARQISKERVERVNTPYTDNLSVGRVTDSRLILRAVRQRWQIPKDFKARLPAMLIEMVGDDRLTRRERRTAARLILELERQNQADEHAAQLTHQHLHLHGDDYHGENVFAEIEKAARVIKAKAQSGELDLGASPITDAQALAASTPTAIDRAGGKRS
jgi:hypothetical protein